MDGQDLRLQEHVAAVGFRLALAPRWSLGLTAGAVLGGTTQSAFYGDFDVTAGWIVGLSGTYTAVTASGGTPSVDLTLSLAAAGRHTRRAAVPKESLVTADLRFGATVGWDIKGVLRPSLSARVFGGPVLWGHDGRTLSGTDRGHVQLTAGLTLTLPAGVSLFGEYSPWFEQGANAGLAVSF